MRADAHRSLIGCVEAFDADHVSVTDLVTEAGADGLRTQIGAYPKLRLAPAAVASWAAAAGLPLDRETADTGMVVQILRAPR